MVQKCFENLSSYNVPTLKGLLQSVHAGEFDSPDRTAFYQFLDIWEKGMEEYADSMGEQDWTEKRAERSQTISTPSPSSETPKRSDPVASMDTDDSSLFQEESVESKLKRTFEVMPEEGTAAEILINHLMERDSHANFMLRTNMAQYLNEKSDQLGSKGDAWKLIEYELTLPGNPDDA